MSTARLPRPASFLLLPLLALLLTCESTAAQTLKGPGGKAKPPAAGPKEAGKPPAAEAPPPAKAEAALGNRVGIAAPKGISSDRSENEGGKDDEPFGPRAWLKRRPMSAGSAAGASGKAAAALMRLADHPKRDQSLVERRLTVSPVRMVHAKPRSTACSACFGAAASETRSA